MTDAPSPANPLIGTWRLVSMDFRQADGRIVQPYGAAPVGLLLFTAEGRMSLTVMHGSRPPFGLGFRPGQGLAEKASAFDSYLSYAGRYDFHGDRVVYHLEAALYPDLVGATLERLVELRGNQLLITTPPNARRGQRATTRLVWERGGDNSPAAE